MTSGLGALAEPVQHMAMENCTLLLAMPVACSMTLSITFLLWALVSKRFEELLRSLPMVLGLKS